MIKKIILIIAAIVMTIITLAAAVNAYTYSGIQRYDLYPTYSYGYAHDSSKYNRIPVVTGPYSEDYLWGSSGHYFAHDDFNHYDEFIGYKDLDIIKADGKVQVIRNTNARNMEIPELPEGTQIFGHHVHGVLPDNSVYRKHYHHEHPWQINAMPVYPGYYTPYNACRNKPVYTNRCGSTSPCEYRYGC